MKAWVFRNHEQKPIKQGALKGYTTAYITKLGLPFASDIKNWLGETGEQNAVPVPDGMLVIFPYDLLYVGIGGGEVVPYPGKLTVEQIVVEEKEEDESQDRQPA